MKRRIKRLSPFLLVLTIAANLSSGIVQAAGKKTETIPSGIATKDVEKEVDSFVGQYIGDSVPGAVVVVVDDGEVVLEKGYGESNLTTKTKMDIEKTTFELGTLTKMYTYTAIMQQVEAGAVDLSADIFTYLPEDFAAKLKKKLVSEEPITVLHLINNTAGFEETGFDITVSTPDSLDATLREALETTMPEQIYAPGEVMTGASYSSALLGYIVECITGKEFSEYVAEEIFAPLGAESSVLMADTTKDAKVNDAKAVAYGLGSEGEFRTVDNMYSNLYPNSGAVVSGKDLEKFLLSYLPEEGEEGALLKTKTIKSMLTKTYSINENAKGQGIGFYEYPSDEVTAYYHDGTSNGYSSMMTIMPEEGFGIAVMTNSAISKEFIYGLTDLLLHGQEEGKSPSPAENTEFPDLSDFLSSSFIGARRSYNNVLEIAGYLGNCSTFKKGSDNTIVLDSNEYEQVMPYVFQYVESSDKDKNTVLQKTIAKYIYFGHDETGKVTKWTYSGSGTTEFVVMESSSSQSYLTLGIFAVIVGGLLSAALFSTSLLLTALNVVQKKKIIGMPRIAFRISTILFVGLEFNVVNELTKLLENSLVASKDIFWNTVLNYGLTAAILVSFGYFIYCRNNEEIKPGRAVFYGVVYAFMALFIGIMFVWKFFGIL